MNKKDRKVGLALGGGGARGLAHLGVLYVLEKNDIPVQLITGTSMGALIAALYAFHGDAKNVGRIFFESQETPEYKALCLDKIAERAREEGFFGNIRNSMAYHYLQQSMGVLKAEETAEFLATLFRDIGFGDLKMPVGLVAANINTCRGVCFRSGDLRKAVQASMSLPVWMEPVEIDGDLYVDGIAHDVVPVREARDMGADVVIAVDISLRNPRPQIRNALEVKAVADSMSVNRSIDLSLEYADIVVRPDVGDIMWYDFGKVPELIRAGREAALGMLSAINKFL